MPHSTLLQALAAALGWTITDSLWIITLVFLGYRLLAWLFPARNRLLYYLGLSGLLVVSISSVYSFRAHFEWAQIEIDNRNIQLLSDNPAWQFTNPQPVATSVELSAMTLYDRFAALIDPWTPYVGLLWSICFAVLYARLLGGYWMAQRLRYRGTSPLPAEWEAKSRKIIEKMGFKRPIRILESSKTGEPLTLGFLKPLILFPAGLCLQLSPAQVEVLILHELAHIRRYDYLVNLLQLFLDVCFFYHPLYRLLSREIRTRREYCCDDWVLRHCANRLLYAKTLTELQQSLVQTKHAFVMNATGNNSFTERIFRIAGIQPKRRQRPGWFALLFFCVLIGAGGLWSSFTLSSSENQSVNNQELSLLEPMERTVSTAPITINQQPEITPEETVVPGPDSVGKPTIAMEATKMNVLYIGVDNPITLAVPGYDCASLLIKMDVPGVVTPLGDCNFNVTVKQPGKVVFSIYHLEKGKETLLGTRYFRTKRIPDPVPMINGRLGGRITVKGLAEMTHISAMLVNFDYDANCEVVGFSFTYLPNEQNPIPFDTQKGGEFNKEILALFTAAKPGDKFFFDDIKVKCLGDAAARNLGGMILKVVE